jgi:thiazole synthase
MTDPTEPTSSPSNDDALIIGGRTFSSRLFVGTGKYKDVAETRAAPRGRAPRW